MSNEMPDELRTVLLNSRQSGNFDAVVEAVPYAKLLGIQLHSMDLQPTFIVPANKDNIGNPMLPAIHGGVIAGSMETAGALHLLMTMESIALPKIIDFSIDYLRAGRLQDACRTPTSVVRSGGRAAGLLMSRLTPGNLIRLSLSQRPGLTSYWCRTKDSVVQRVSAVVFQIEALIEGNDASLPSTGRRLYTTSELSVGVPDPLLI